MYNNQTDTDRIRKVILIFPVFCPQRHEKIHGHGNTHKGRENLSEAKRMGKWTILWGWVEKNKKFAWKNKKNLLGGSLTVALPRKGEGVPLPVVSPVSPDICRNTGYISVCLNDERHTEKQHTHKPYKSPSEAYQEAQKRTSLS